MNNRKFTVTTIPGKGQLLSGHISMGDAGHIMSAFAKDHPGAYLHPGIASASYAIIALVEDAAAAKKWEQEIADDLARRYHDRPECRWLFGTDTGLSSKALFYAAAFACTHRPPQNGIPSGHTPADADDLGRCIRMIEAIPYVRDNLPAVLRKAGELWPLWQPFADVWDQLTTQYHHAVQTQNFTDLNTRIRQLGDRRWTTPTAKADSETTAVRP